MDPIVYGLALALAVFFVGFAIRNRHCGSNQKADETLAGSGFFGADSSDSGHHDGGFDGGHAGH